MIWQILFNSLKMEDVLKAVEVGSPYDWYHFLVCMQNKKRCGRFEFSCYFLRINLIHFHWPVICCFFHSSHSLVFFWLSVPFVAITAANPVFEVDSSPLTLLLINLCSYEGELGLLRGLAVEMVTKVTMDRIITILVFIFNFYGRTWLLLWNRLVFSSCWLF